MQVVAQAEVRVLERDLGDDVEGAADGEHQVDVAERLEAAAQPRSRPPHALGDDPQLAEARGEDGEHRSASPRSMLRSTIASVL